MSSVDGEQIRFRSPFVPDNILRHHIQALRGLVANPLELLADALMESVRRVQSPLPIRAPRTSTTQTQAGVCRRVSPALKGETVRAKAGTRGDELLKIDQLASRLKVSVGCIRAWRLRGRVLRRSGLARRCVGTQLRSMNGSTLAASREWTRRPMIEARTGPNGARVYRARVYFRGRYVASRTFPRKRDAQEWERKQVETLKTGAWADPKAGELPVREWCEIWLAAQPARAQATERKIRGVVAKQIAGTFGRRPLVSVRPSEVQAWAADISRKQSAATARHSLGVLRRVFDHAVRDGAIHRNPAAGIRLPKVQGNDPRPLTHDELWKLADHLHEPGPHPRAGRRILRPAVGRACGSAVGRRRFRQANTARCACVLRRSATGRFVVRQRPPGPDCAHPGDRVGGTR